MKITGLSEKSLKFEGQHVDEIMYTPGVLIQIVERDSRLHIMLELTEETTSKQIIKAIPYALKRRDQLMEWQGIWTGGGDNLFLIELDYRHKGGQSSYAAIATQINQRIENYLRLYVQFVGEYKAALPQFKVWGDYLKWQHAEDDLEQDKPDRLERSFGLDHARSLLEAIRFKDDQMNIDAILKDGMERIARDDPFEKGYPVDAERVKATLKSWRESRKYKIHKRLEDEQERQFLESRNRSTP